MPPAKKDCLACPTADCLLRLCPPSVPDYEAERPREQVFFPRGKVLFTQGETGRCVYLIQSGLVKTEMTDDSGGNIVLGFRGKGEPLGHQDLGSSKLHSHSAVAVEDSNVCVIEHGHFQSQVDACGPLKDRLYHLVVQEARDYGLRLISMAHRSVNARVAESLMHICRVYGYREDGRSLRIQIDREEMADYAGTTKEQVSKALGEFKRKGAINFRAKHFKHIDMAALSAYSGRPPQEKGPKSPYMPDGPEDDGAGNIKIPAVA